MLSTARSGSTLLRFILDSHPVLACPPESDVALAFRHLLRMRTILEEARTGTGGQGPSAGLPEHIAAAVRRPVDEAFAEYLRSVGKKRWCDKSPDSVWDAEILPELYPRARFISLYRHPMDVIASLVESHPFGLGDGLAARHQHLAAQYPGNMVATAGAYWQAHVERMLAFEAMHPDRCLRIRYEDLATAPEPTAARIFSFLGVKQVPGITEECFRVEHARQGPGDKKIWLTDRVSADSLGRGVRIPASFLPAPMRRDVNRLLEMLGYRPVDRAWNEAVGRTDPRADRAAPSRPGADGGGGDDPSSPVREIDGRLGALSPGDLHAIRERWPFLAGQVVRIVVDDPAGRSQSLAWRFSPAGTEAALQRLPAAPAPADRRADPITLAADPATWDALMSGTANVDVERKAGRLRHFQRIPARGAAVTRWDEIHAVSALLGLAPVPAGRERAKDTAAKN
ncbi:sulfotransferase family protein [Actinomadura fibrosa]|uniref:Sulfotransferase family protein n=1 Tax=Actinomadura fibrosa TaxID=111802 RepID=A0ABW2XWQ5_9ACTN|nr:sulfotransferase [Actinomadura fibrosa]